MSTRKRRVTLLTMRVLRVCPLVWACRARGIDVPVRTHFNIKWTNPMEARPYLVCSTSIASEELGISVRAAKHIANSFDGIHEGESIRYARQLGIL